MVEIMLTRGVPSDVILLAIETVEAERHAVMSHVTLDVTPGAERTRRWRQKNQQKQEVAEANDAATSAVTERHINRHSVTPHCDLSSLSLETTEEVKKLSKTRARGTRLSPEVHLSDDNRKFALENGVSDPDRGWAEFIDYWIGVPGQRGTKLNWDATWRNRVRAISMKGKPNGQNNVLAAADRLVERFRQFNAPAPGARAVRDGTGEAPVRPIPEG